MRRTKWRKWMVLVTAVGLLCGQPGPVPVWAEELPDAGTMTEATIEISEESAAEPGTEGGASGEETVELEAVPGDVEGEMTAEESEEEYTEESDETLPEESGEESAEESDETLPEESEEESAEESEETLPEESEEESAEESDETLPEESEEEATEEVAAGLNELLAGESDIEVSASNVAGNMLVDKNWTLTTDTTVTGSLTITSGTVDLNGYTLNIGGNLIQEGGTVKINRGSLNVSGDFTQEEGYRSYLRMQYTNDTVVVGGSYKTYSTASNYSSSFSTGTLKIAGDLIAGAGDEYNFSSGENLQVILTGSGSHQISFLETNNSYIGNLTVESGKITANEMLNISKLNSDLEITGYSGKSFTLRQLNANGHTVSVSGDVITTNKFLGITSAKNIDLAGGKLTVKGSLTQQGGTINVNKGVLTVSGDFVQKEGYSSRLTMQNTNDTVVVGGSYKTYSAGEDGLTTGTLRIAGDLIAGAGSKKNFCSGENLQVILTGSGSHQISFLETNSSNIGNLTVESGKITANEMLSIGKLNNDLEITGYSGKSFTLRQLNANGHTVSVPGDVITTGKIDLAGAKLTVKGSLTQQGGTIYVNKGVLTVSGDFVQKEGYGSGLEMKYTNDTIVVGGSYKTYSAWGSSSLNTGTLRIAGDLIAGAGNKENFSSGANLQVILTGSGSHQISFLETNNSYIGNLTVESGKITANEMLNISKLNSDLEITGYSGKSFTLRELNANGHTVSVPGDVITTGNIDLAGGKLAVKGSLTQQGGTINVNKGALTVSGDFVQKEGYSSRLTMQNTNDIVRVEGNYATYSTASHSGNLSAGELTVNGNFTQGQGNSYSFCATGSHITRLTGEQLQTVVFTPDGNGKYFSQFNILDVNKDIKTGYRFTPDKCWNKLLGYEDVPEAEQQVRNFVSRMYTVALGRNAEEQGLMDWTDRLLLHEVDGAGIAYGFIMSGEFQNRNLSNGEFVDVLYRTFFNREADEGGRSVWLSELAAGRTRGYVLSGFVNSVEFDNLCDSYGIVRGTMREDGSPCNPGIRSFVERCYTKVLGRAGEKAGIEDWTNRIASGQMSAEDVAKSFFFSEEYTNKNTSNETFVETLYQTFMDRASDPAGKRDWVGRLNGGTSRQEVLEGFSRSTEFAGILQSFGL